jgi:uncharacterized protein YjiS (DUF1127 family)
MALTHTYENKSPSFFANLMGAVARWFVNVTEANWRIREAERLNAMSDDMLASKGIKREDIARHVFRDVMWL